MNFMFEEQLTHDPLYQKEELIQAKLPTRKHKFLKSKYSPGQMDNRIVCKIFKLQ